MIMERIIFSSVFVIGCILQLLIRLRYISVSRKSGALKRKLLFFDLFLVSLSVIGFYILPLISIGTPWLDAFNYRLPLVISIIFGTLYIFGLFIFYKAHTDLGKYWWMGYELSYEKELVTEGIYAWIRHPMYVGFFLIGCGNVFILHNWIAGFSHLVTFFPLYLYHVPREERHLKEQFGEAFSHYREYTGKVFPARRKAGR